MSPPRQEEYTTASHLTDEKEVCIAAQAFEGHAQTGCTSHPACAVQNCAGYDMLVRSSPIHSLTHFLIPSFFSSAPPAALLSTLSTLFRHATDCIPSRPRALDACQSEHAFAEQTEDDSRSEPVADSGYTATGHGVWKL